MTTTWRTDGGSVAVAHRAAIADGCAIAERFVDLHQAAIARIVTVMKEPAREKTKDRALFALGVHGLNLIHAAMGLVIRGQLDVSPYLFRAIFDCHSVMAACAIDEAFALELRAPNDGFAGRARIRAVSFFKQSGEPELAALLNERYLIDKDLMNYTAHISGDHLDRLFDGHGSAVAGGLVNETEAKAQWASLLTMQHRLLIWLLRFGDMTDDWRQSLESVSAESKVFCDAQRRADISR